MKTIAEIAEEVSQIIDDKFSGNGYFKATKLLGMKTKRGTIPSCFIHTINRTAGKTSFYALFSIYAFKEYGYNSMYLVRSVSELDGYENTFRDILEMYYPDINITSKSIIKNTLYGIYLDGEEAFYITCMKKSDTIKKFSPLFRNVLIIVIEEYQPMDGKFVKNEISHVNSIVRSVARGGGKQVRNDCHLILIGNPITLMNPYLVSFDVIKFYKKDRKYIFTNSLAAEFSINEESSKKILESGFSDLFGSELSGNDAGLDFILRDSDYIRNIPKKTRYVCTIIMEKRFYGVRIFGEMSVHISSKADPNCENVLAFFESDRLSIAKLIERKDYTFSIIRDAYKMGRLYFDSIGTKELIFQLLGVDAYSRIC